MHTKCHKIHTLPAEMYPTCIEAYLYMYNQMKNNFTPLSANLIIEEVILVFENTVISAKLRAWYGVGFTSTRVTWAQIFFHLQIFNSLHSFEDFANVVHSGLTSPRSSASHPQLATAMDYSFNYVLFDQI